MINTSCSIFGEKCETHFLHFTHYYPRFWRWQKVDGLFTIYGITKANYYWRLRRVREAFLETNEIPPVFVEIPKRALETENHTSSAMKIVAVLKGNNRLSLEITDQAPPTFLNTVLEALHHAE